MEREVHRTLEDVGEEDRITARTQKAGLHSLAEIEDETVWSHICSSKERTGFAKEEFATRMSTRLNARQKVPSQTTPLKENFYKTGKKRI